VCSAIWSIGSEAASRGPSASTDILVLVCPYSLAYVTHECPRCCLANLMKSLVYVSVFVHSCHNADNFASHFKSIFSANDPIKAETIR